MGEKKNYDRLSFPEDVQYYQEHIWVKVTGKEVIIGISDFAQNQLGEIIFVELAIIGDNFAKGEVFGQLESSKSVSALYMPISCKILTVNKDVEDSPYLVNKAPYGEGWLVAVKPNDLTELKDLLTKEEYICLLKESQEF